MLDEHNDFLWGGDYGGRESSEEADHLASPIKVTKGKLSRNPGVAEHKAVIEEPCQVGPPGSEVLDPDGGVNQDQELLGPPSRDLAERRLGPTELGQPTSTLPLDEGT